MHKDVGLKCKSNMYIYSIHTVHEVILQQHSCQVDVRPEHQLQWHVDANWSNIHFTGGNSM